MVYRTGYQVKLLATTSSIGSCQRRLLVYTRAPGLQPCAQQLLSSLSNLVVLLASLIAQLSCNYGSAYLRQQLGLTLPCADRFHNPQTGFALVLMLCIQQLAYNPKQLGCDIDTLGSAAMLSIWDCLFDCLAPATPPTRLKSYTLNPTPPNGSRATQKTA